ncbi:flavin reductase family protein [Pseudonocardia alni]|uniref:flavin reductase family protein n=1 Tax=Pseudonocardia alni TaxID=33907 RepID=UPI00331E94D5
MKELRSPQELRDVFAHVPSGVVGVCATVDGRPAGMAVSAFTAVSLDPPLVSICVQRTSRTWPVLRGLDRLGLTVFAEHQDRECRALSAYDGDRFSGIGWSATPGGAVLLDGGALHIECSPDREVDAGDHVIALLTVVRAGAGNGAGPLVFHGSRFRRLAAL